MTALLEYRPSTALAEAGNLAPGRAPGARTVCSPHLARPIDYFPGLPYDAWHEEALPAATAEWRVLTASEERRLFQQMNLARYHAERLRGELLSGEAAPEMAAELDRLMRRAQAIREDLLRAFYKLNLSLAGRFANRLNSFEELASEGYIVLWRALERFNPERGFRFSTYATHALRRRMLRVLTGRHRRRQKEWPLNDDRAASGGRWTLDYEQRVASTVTALERLLHRLSPRERYVLRSRFGWGREFDTRTLQQVADEMGVSRERIRQLECRAIKKLRALAKQDGLD